MKPRAMRVGSACATAIAVVAACSVYSEEKDVETPPRPDAATDAPSDAEPATDAGTDADADATTLPCTATTPVLAEDFSAGYGANWVFQTGDCDDAGARTVSRDAGDNAIAMACSTQVPQSFAVLTSKLTFPLGRETSLALTFRIGDTNPHIFAQIIGLVGATGDNLALATAPDAIRVYNLRDGVELTSWLPGDQSKWRTMLIAAQPKTTAGNATVVMRAVLDGETRTFELTRSQDAGSAIGLQVGVYAQSAGAFDDSFDDVRLWSCP